MVGFARCWTRACCGAWLQPQPRGGDEVSLSPTGIQLNAKQSLWFLLSFIFPLQIEVDGAVSKGTWGPQLLNVAPGMHRIAVTWKMYWVLPVNRGAIEVNVP